MCVIRRKVYDETGIVGDEVLGGAKFDDLVAYFRDLYKPITEDDIDEFMVGKNLMSRYPGARPGPPKGQL